MVWTQCLQSPWALSLRSVTLADFQCPSCVLLPLWFYLQGLWGAALSYLLWGVVGAHLGLPFLAGEDSVPFSTQATSSSLAHAGLRP